MSGPALVHQHVPTNGVVLHVVTAGADDAPAIVLLHGFPEFWGAWRLHVAPLVEAGYRVIVPDQRGYGESEKPRALAGYALDVLAKDILGLLDAFGIEQAAIVGHDWGAAVAWWAAMSAPDRVRHLVAINVPHPVVMRARLRTDPAQIGRSWYMFFFQLPLLPEALLGAGGGRGFFRQLARSAGPGAFEPGDEAAYLEAWARPGAFRGMISWYRAAARWLAAPLPEDPRVRPPTLVIWGVGDPFLGRELASDSLLFCDRGSLLWFEGATHWVQHEERPRVVAAILEHLAR